MRTTIIGEVGINHAGDIDIAKRIIDTAVKYGHDYIKFQRRTIDLVYTKEELDKPRESKFGTTTREQKNGIELTQDQYREIDTYCKSKNIKWFASCWDPITVKEMMEFNPPFFKIPSALITNFELLEEVLATDVPIIISTGMSTAEEVAECVKYIGKNLNCIMACCSTYPSADNEMNMDFIKTLKFEYGSKYKIGFSNHSPSTYFLTIAPLLGAEVVEYHMTHDRSDKNSSDNAASIEESGSRIIASHIKSLEVAMGTGYWGVRPSEVPIMKKLRFNSYKR